MKYYRFYSLTIICFAIVLLLSNTVVAQKSGQMPLLAVSEIGDKMVGNVAEISLEVIPGNGRVFLDTFPLTKLDTQMSTRFAKEIACNYYDIDCSSYDFIYTIRAQSSIVGGPSAGSAIAILTAAVLLDKEINESVAITGTINSGAIIGTVSGIEAKIRAAQEHNITKIIIPFGSSAREETDSLFEILIQNLTITDGNKTLDSNVTNKTVNFIELGNEINIEVIEASLLDDAMFAFTGFKRNGKHKEIVMSKSYSETMEKVSLGLCNRTNMFSKSVEEKKVEEYYNDSRVVTAINLSAKSRMALDIDSFYSAASYCFGANVQYSIFLANVSNVDTVNRSVALKEKIIEFEAEFNSQDISTKTDLETFIVVNERIQEALDTIESINTTDDYFNYGYAKERFFSAISWSTFLGKGKGELALDQNSMRNSCIIKLKEAEERYHYTNLLVPEFFPNIKKLIDDSYEELSEGRFDLCLFKASKAKAQSNVFLGVYGRARDDIEDLVKIKLEVIEQVISEQNSKGNFPIIGFSYYEYSKSLGEYDRISSLLYAEYALELSDLDMYFAKKKVQPRVEIDVEKLIVFCIGMFIGLLIGIISVSMLRKKGK